MSYAEGLRRPLLLVLALIGACRMPPPMVPSEEARIRNIEDGLVPAVVIRGQTRGRSIEERMACYGVAGAGIAVIDAGRVIWSRGYGANVDAGTRFPDGVPADAARELVARGTPENGGGRTYDPARRQGAVVYTTSAHGGPLAGEILRAIAEEYGWPGYPKAVVALDPADLGEYAGRYRVGSSAVVVARAGAKLTITTPGGEAAELFPEARDRFFLLVEQGATVTFERGPDGKIATLVAKIGEREIRGEREL